ncbi:protein pitchfork [Cynoglossus semilaevis]|uniref:protein pitchfork n=1 Tax=Cynoglossus semilaevis TaxID=244447 RepID=UPI000495F325|nr:protein pitchfork [Cynoglossus semilaevis]
MTESTVRRSAFGSGQHRKLFPLHYAPDRLGNQMSRLNAPHVGPGCYNNHEYGTIIYEIERTPGSKRGYCLSARTAARFPPDIQTSTPSPQLYQPDQSQSRTVLPGKTPFNSSAERFKGRLSTVETNPGPGTYDYNAVTNRKVSWPMCFGRPDWSRLPQLEKKSLRVMLNGEKEFLKHRSRVAYLSLYY